MDIVEATVTSIQRGRSGPFAIAISKSEKVKGSITFSLDQKVWHEEDLPEPGDTVQLSALRKKRAGWRAMCGQFEKLADTE